MFYFYYWNVGCVFFLQWDINNVRLYGIFDYFEFYECVSVNGFDFIDVREVYDMDEEWEFMVQLFD